MVSKIEIKPGELVAIENTGERMVPEVSGGSTFWEHVYRYAFACRFAKGKRVLDIACGEGYGSAALQKAGATHVIGVDISEDACRHASRRYGVETRVGSAEDIPLAEGSVDLIVSFETIEHVPNPHKFLDECKRVLVSGGQLVISTPNKDVYSAPGQPANPHHCSEMTEGEFMSALRSRFCDVALYSQHSHWAAWWSLRSLSSDDTPWNQSRLFQRLRRSARFRLARMCVNEPGIEERASIIDQIVEEKNRGASFLIPYLVRRRQAGGERPFYFVATATLDNEAKKRPYANS